jgi:hypothetical protein
VSRIDLKTFYFNAGESEVEEAIQNSNSDPEAMAASQLSRA